MTSPIEQQILRLNVPMGDSHRMQIGNSFENLLEVAIDRRARHIALLDRRVQIAARAVLHHLTPMMTFVLDEIDGFDHVGVVQGGRDAELRGELLNVVFLRLVLASLSEFLTKEKG